jgi:hypothetical protein
MWLALMKVTFALAGLARLAGPRLGLKDLSVVRKLTVKTNTPDLQLPDAGFATQEL